MADVKINLDATGTGTVEVDGHDIAPWTQRLELSVAAGRGTELRLSLVPPAPTALELKEAAVTIHGPLREVLLNAGWTQPGDMVDMAELKALREFFDVWHNRITTYDPGGNDPINLDGVVLYGIASLIDIDDAMKLDDASERVLAVQGKLPRSSEVEHVEAASPLNDQETP